MSRLIVLALFFVPLTSFGQQSIQRVTVFDQTISRTCPGPTANGVCDGSSFEFEFDIPKFNPNDGQLVDLSCSVTGSGSSNATLSYTTTSPVSTTLPSGWLRANISGSFFPSIHEGNPLFELGNGYFSGVSAWTDIGAGTQTRQRSGNFFTSTVCSSGPRPQSLLDVFIGDGSMPLMMKLDEEVTLDYDVQGTGVTVDNISLATSGDIQIKVEYLYLPTGRPVIENFSAISFTDTNQADLPTTGGGISRASAGQVVLVKAALSLDVPEGAIDPAVAAQELDVLFRINDQEALGPRLFVNGNEKTGRSLGTIGELLGENNGVVNIAFRMKPQFIGLRDVDIIIDPNSDIFDESASAESRIRTFLNIEGLDLIKLTDENDVPLEILGVGGQTEAGQLTKYKLAFDFGITSSDLNASAKEKELKIDLRIDGEEALGPRLFVNGNEKFDRNLGTIGELLDEGSQINIVFRSRPSFFGIKDIEITLDPEREVAFTSETRTIPLRSYLSGDISIIPESIRISQVVFEPDFDDDFIIDLVEGRNAMIEAKILFVNRNQEPVVIPPGFRDSLVNGVFGEFDNGSPAVSFLGKSVNAVESNDMVTFGDLIDSGDDGVTVRYLLPKEQLGSIAGPLNKSFTFEVAFDQGAKFNDAEELNNELSQTKSFQTFKTTPLKIGYVNISPTCPGCQYPEELSFGDIKITSENMIRKMFPIDFEKGLTTQNLPDITATINESFFILESLDKDEFGQPVTRVRVNQGYMEDVVKLGNLTHRNDVNYVVAFVGPQYLKHNIKTIDRFGNLTPTQPDWQGYNQRKVPELVGGPPVLNRNIVKVAMVKDFAPLYTIAHELGHGLGANPPQGNHPDPNLRFEKFDSHDPIVSSRYLKNSPSIMNGEIDENSLDPDRELSWISPSEYERLLETFTSPNLDPELIVLSGFVTKTGEIITLNTEILEAGILTNTTVGADVEVNLIDAEGVSIRGLSFQPGFQFALDGSDGFEGLFESEVAPFSVALPFDNGGVSVTISIEGEVVAEVDPVCASLIDTINRIPDSVFRFGRVDKTKAIWLKLVGKMERAIEKNKTRKAKILLRVLEGWVKFKLKKNVTVESTEKNREDLLSLINLVKERL